MTERTFRKTWGLTVLSLVALMLAGLAMPAAAAEEGETLIWQVPKCTKAPVADGKVEEGEWDEAVKINGLLRTGTQFVLNREAIWYVTWDENGLYLLCRRPLRPGERLKRQFRGRVGDAVMDDSVEFYVDTDHRNEGPTDSMAYYQLIVNSLGAGDFGIHKPAMGVVDRSWMPSATIGNVVTKDQKYWNFEIAFSNEDLNLQRPTRPGDRWRLNLAHDFKNGWEQAALPLTAADWKTPSVYGQYYCRPANTPFVKLDSAQPVRSDGGPIGVDLTLVNPTNKPVEFTVHTKGQYKANVLFDDTEKVTVPAGQSKQIKPRGSIKIDGNPFPLGDLRNLRYDLTVTAPGYEKPLARWWGNSNYRTDEGDERYWHEWENKPLEPAIHFEYNPVRSNIDLAFDVIDLPIEQREGAKVVWAVKAKGGKEIASGEFDDQFHYYIRHLIELPELSPGEYTIDMAMVSAEGATLYPKTLEFEKLDEAKEFPWWNTKLGNPDQLLPPFTALGYDKSTGVATMCNRQYTLDGLGLPKKIVSTNAMSPVQEPEVVPAPTKLNVVVDGEMQAVKTADKPSLVSAKDYEIDWTGAATAGPVKIDTKVRLEQDGALFVDLTYAPAGDEPVTIDEFVMEIPLRGDIECAQGQAAGGSESLVLLPTDTQGVIWDSTTLPQYLEEGFWIPVIWFGDDRNGLFIWGDNDKGWAPSNDVVAQQLVRDGDKLYFRANFIKAEPLELTGPRTISFILTATPTKPYTPEWRVGPPLTHGMSGAFNVLNNDPDKNEQERWELSHRVDPKTGVNGWTWFHPESKDPNDWMKYYDKMRESDWSEQKKIGLPTGGWGNLTGFDRDKSYFAAEWGNNECTPTLLDHYIWAFYGYCKYGKIDSVYLDVSNLMLSDNLSNGSAYRLPDGRIQKGYFPTRRRQLHKRLAACFYENDLPGGVSGNNTGLLPAWTFCQSYMAGDDNLKVGGDIDFADLRTEPWFRALIDPAILGGVKRPIFSHGWDTLMEGQMSLFNTFEHQGTSYHAQLGNWGGYEKGDKQTFYPYWRNQGSVKIDKATPNVKCSLLKQEDSIMGTVFNYEDEKTVVCDITVDTTKMGLKPTKRFLTVMRINLVDRGTAWQQRLHDPNEPQNIQKLDLTQVSPGVYKISNVTIHPRNYFQFTLDPQTDEIMKRNTSGVASSKNEWLRSKGVSNDMRDQWVSPIIPLD